jgi:uncharacterized protein (TIGR02598 family)
MEEEAPIMGSVLLHGMNFKFYHKKNGMTLSEVMFATAILSVVLVSMIGTLTGGLEALQKSTNYNQANIIARRTIEDYKAMDYATLSNLNTTINGFDVEVKVNAGTYNFNSKMENYKQVIVEVSTKVNTSIKKSVYVKMETMFINLQ